MRHGKRFNHLSRTSAHRKAMLANMASSLIIHKRIKTTVAKAKALRTYIEPLITKSKTDSTHSRRVVFSYLNDKEAVTELFREVSVKVADRPGGYTRIIKIGSRLGDNAEMALIELVDYNENLLQEKAKGPKKTRRRRGGGGAAKAETETAVAAETVEENTEDSIQDTEDSIPDTEEKAEVVKEEVEAKVEEKPEASSEEPEAEEPKEEKKEEVKEEEVEAKVEEKPEASSEEPEAEEPKEEKKEEKPASTEAKADEPEASSEEPEADTEDKKKEE